MPKQGIAEEPRNRAHASFMAAARLVGIAFFALWSQPAIAQQLEDTSPYSDASLVAEFSSIQPGVPFSVGLYLAMDAGWHSYWINPGDAGMPTSIEWDLPNGFQAGDIQWPHPIASRDNATIQLGARFICDIEWAGRLADLHRDLSSGLDRPHP
jgi:DsbC/DsbD-like thiol-disulfide interchange protein